MSDKKAYLVITSDENIQVIYEAEELDALEFDSEEEASEVKIFEIEFKKKVSFNTKVKLNISE